MEIAPSNSAELSFSPRADCDAILISSESVLGSRWLTLSPETEWEPEHSMAGLHRTGMQHTLHETATEGVHGSFSSSPLRGTPSGHSPTRESPHVVDDPPRDQRAGTRWLQMIPEKVAPSVLSTTVTSLPSCLLSEKWQPQAYTDLISDEKVNVEVMTFFQGFHHTLTAAEKAPVHGFRLLVLHGAPGVGKTTIVRVIAQHWGFDVVEINASNERNTAELRKQLVSVTADVKSNGGTPKCLVLEEIDGMTSNAIQFLSSREFLESCARPIVCVANELYGVALRPLRFQSLVKILHVPAVKLSRLQQRLRELIDAERLWLAIPRPLLDLELRKLAQVCDGDIRVGLNLLQFSFMSQFQDDGTRTSAGHTLPKGYFALCRWLLQPRSGAAVTESLRDSELLQELLRIDDVDVATEGIYEHYLHAFSQDDFLFARSHVASLRCARSFVFSDIRSAPHGSQKLSSGLALLSVHKSIPVGLRRETHIPLQWPRLLRDLKRAQKMFRSVLQDQGNVYHGPKSASSLATARNVLQVVSSTSSSDLVLDVIPAFHGALWRRDFAKLPKAISIQQLSLNQRNVLDPGAKLLCAYQTTLDTSNPLIPSQLPEHVLGMYRELVLNIKAHTRAKRSQEQNKPGPITDPVSPVTSQHGVVQGGTPVHENKRASPSQTVHSSMALRSDPKRRSIKDPAERRDLFGRIIPVKTDQSSQQGRVAKPSVSGSGGVAVCASMPSRGAPHDLEHHSKARQSTQRKVKFRPMTTTTSVIRRAAKLDDFLMGLPNSLVISLQHTPPQLP